jgi:hypothetical protein
MLMIVKDAAAGGQIPNENLWRASCAGARGERHSRRADRSWLSYAVSWRGLESRRLRESIFSAWRTFFFSFFFSKTLMTSRIITREAIQP